jgi:P27 family predicted phage terminase small subunit
MSRGAKPKVIKTGKGALSRAPVAPAWFSPAARAEWKRVVPTLIERGIITVTDLALVEAFCVASGRIKELEALIQADPTDKALYRLANQAMQTARQIAAEIGASPISRSRPAVAESDDANEDDPLGLNE